MDRTNKLFEEWTTLQPLKPEDQKRLDDKLNLEFNYNSNHIEGNTLTYGETILVNEFASIIEDEKGEDVASMKAHMLGLCYVRKLAGDQLIPLMEKQIKELNEILLVKNFEKFNSLTGVKYTIHVGQYKEYQNFTKTEAGEEFYYATPDDTPELMRNLVSWYNKEVKSEKLNPIELAALFHYRYIRIHPFEDGNGRIARLLVNYILLRFGYPMVIIRSENKDEYLQALHQCDVAVGLTPGEGAVASLEDIQPFVKYLNKEIESSLNLGIKAAKGESIIEDKDWRKTLKVSNSVS